MMWYTCTTACVRKLNTAACDLIARSVPKTLGSPFIAHEYVLYTYERFQSEKTCVACGAE